MRIPSDFDPDWYLAVNSDVATFSGNARKHYILHGRREGRSYKPTARFIPLSKEDAEQVALVRHGENGRFQSPVSPNQTKKAAIIAHFDQDNVLDDYFMDSLRAYRPYFDCIVLVTASNMNSNDKEDARKSVDRIIQRKNVGYDFMSWRVGFESLVIENFSTVTFLNDSIYGPWSNLDAVFSVGKDVDLWGASLSREIYPHVQSFCMTFGPRMIESGFAASFWSSVGPIENKPEIIINYEIGLSYLASKAGFKLGAFTDLGSPSDAMRASALADNGLSNDNTETPAFKTIMLEEKPNPTQLFWNVALRLGFPFVKIEILRSNPMGVDRAAVMNAMLEQGYDTEVVLRHLGRVMGSSAFELLLSELSAEYVHPSMTPAPDESKPTREQTGHRAPTRGEYRRDSV